MFEKQERHIIDVDVEKVRLHARLDVAHWRAHQGFERIDFVVPRIADAAAPCRFGSPPDSGRASAVMSFSHGKERFGATDLRYRQLTLVQERDGAEGTRGKDGVVDDCINDTVACDGV